MDKQNKVVVVGSGLMGTGIAHAFITRGYGVSLVDTNNEALTKSRANLEIMIDEGISRGKLSRDEGVLAMGRLNTTDKLAEQHADASLLIETVSENIAIKKAVLREASSILSHEAVIATNTSAMSVTDIASAAVSESVTWTHG